MDKKILIVGHGLAGCTLALTFYRKNIPFKLIGCSQVGEASMASSGLIAPITGRRYVKAWRIDEFVPKALEFYRWTEGLTGGEFFFPVENVRYLSHQEGRTAWERRLYDPEYAQYISDKKSAKLDALNRPYGIVTGGYRLDTPGWLNAVRGFLSEKGLLEIIDSPYPTDTPHEGIKIFATGAVDPSVAARVIPNKGESLLLMMPDWRIREVIKEEVFIVPLNAIEKVYNGSVKVVKHMAGVRPTVNDRRPLIGPLAGRPGQYIFNGMGTKGTSLAPFWAEQLVAHITEDLPLPAEVLPDRYIP